MQQNNQHKVIYMQLCLKLAKNYRKTKHQETGTTIAYDIKELKTHPRKLQRRMELKKDHYEYNNKLTTKQNWRNIEKEIHSALVETYPQQKQNTTRKRQRMVNTTKKLEYTRRTTNNGISNFQKKKPTKKT